MGYSFPMLAAALGACLLSAESYPVGTCAMNQTAHCPLPKWKPTYNLSESSIMYQPWCINDGGEDCTGLINITEWWRNPGRRDAGSTADAHWGLLSLDDSESTHMWAATTYGGATPGNPLTFRAQKAMLDICANVKGNGWADRCFVYDNMVVSLGWYETHRAKMMDTVAGWPMFNIMRNDNISERRALGLANYTGLPMMDPLGGLTTLTPCWTLPNTSAGFDRHSWCGVGGLNGTDIRLPCFAKSNATYNACEADLDTGGAEGFSYYWNYSAPGVTEWRVKDNLEFVRNGSDSVDGLFTDEMEMFPGDGGDVFLKIIGTDQADANLQLYNGQLAHQQMIDGLVAEGKYLWQAFQGGNNVGGNNNNNSQGQGGEAHDAAFCTQWMAQRCNTDWVNQRAITVQFDSFNVLESIASFLVVRPAFAWIGYGAGIVPPKWNDAFLWDVGVPKGECHNGSQPGVFEREWTYGVASMDCNSFTGKVPCNPADAKCGKAPAPTPPPPPPPPPPAPPGPPHPHPPGPSPVPPPTPRLP